MAKKTHPVADLLAFANYQLARTDEFATVDFKAGICSMIDRVLHDTGNYEGFGFLDNDDRETGTVGYYSRFYTFSHNIPTITRLNCISLIINTIIPSKATHLGNITRMSFLVFLSITCDTLSLLNPIGRNSCLDI